ncbi:hypothetical protein ncot_16085 [Nocardioides sp. JQ2195]|uniref:hypothetical protein n=1 Tax=Nocardioides sp. JQ2195 TaxID=2592334 RepID=UPI00143E8BBC|nr:hypothetical protein [Nocardioides sp. JQ2195]QIX27937.1 hypothetical protein ncot_16085 [Nocardioides sp. JQ2195]
MARSFEQQLTIPLPPEQVSAQVQRVLMALPKAGNVFVNPPRITADLSMGAFSWGEKLLVHLTQVPGGTQAVVRSECSFPLQLVDYGKNRKNVEKIVAGLQLPPGPAGPPVG